MLESGGSKSSSSQPIRKPQAETSSPLAITGSDRPMNIAKRFAGVASRGESVWYWRSFAIVIVPANTRRHRRGLHRVPDDEERVVLHAAVPAEVGEEEDLEDRPDQHRRDVDRPAGSS